MQIVQVCVWVIFCFRQSQQIVRGHTIVFRQRDDAEGADVLEVIGWKTSIPIHPKHPRDRWDGLG